MAHNHPGQPGTTSSCARGMAHDSPGQPGTMSSCSRVCAGSGAWVVPEWVRATSAVQRRAGWHWCPTVLGHHVPQALHSASWHWCADASRCVVLQTPHGGLRADDVEQDAQGCPSATSTAQARASWRCCAIALGQVQTPRAMYAGCSLRWRAIVLVWSRTPGIAAFMERLMQRPLRADLCGHSGQSV